MPPLHADYIKGLWEMGPASSLDASVLQNAEDPLLCGLLPELAHPAGGLGVRSWLAGHHGVDMVDLQTAMELCDVAAAYYESEVRS